MSKICIVLHDLRGGGAEKMMVRLANQFVADGDDVTMVLVGAGGSNKRFLSEKVALIELSCSRTLQSFAPLRRTLKELCPDAILAALTHINVLTALVCFSLAWQKKLSVSERNAFSLDKNVNPSKVMRATYAIAPIIYKILPRPVIAVSEGVKQDLISTTIVPDAKVVVAPNPVITIETISSSLNAAQHPWLKEKMKPCVVAVGRLSYQKGFDMLLNAFEKVRRKIDCRLIIFGEGDLKKELEQQALKLGVSENVDFAGYYENIIAEMKAADLYVLSSRFEGSPNAIVEAMSVETNVVAFDCPYGASEILLGGKVAPLVPNGDIEAFAQACIEALSSPLEKTGFLSAAVSKFSAKSSASSYKELLIK